MLIYFVIDHFAKLNNILCLLIANCILLRILNDVGYLVQYPQFEKGKTRLY